MQENNSEAGAVEARQRLLGAAMADGSRSRFGGGGRATRGQSSRMRLDAAEHIALAARSIGPAARRVDAAQDKHAGAPLEDATDLATRLRTLAHSKTLLQAELLDALARFDELEIWRADGARNCIQWLCTELGVSRSLAYSQLFVARKLRDLPIIAALFQAGDLTWSKVQALTRVATPDDERALAIMALDLDANEVQQVCDEYRWGKADRSAGDDAERDRQRFARRSLTWSHLPDGSLAFRAVLPPDMAANFLACLEHQESLEYANEGRKGERDETAQRSSAQRRADALEAMGEASLEAAGDGVSTADRFQVVVHVDADALQESADEIARSADADADANANAGRGRGRVHAESARDEGAPASNAVNPAASSDPAESSTGLDDSEQSSAEPDAHPDTASSPEAPLPLPIRAAIAGVGGITPSTARRLACDGSLVTLIMKNGEPLSIGRKTRRWSPATRRAVLARDGGCTFPGCGSTRNLDIHHVHGWALGGETSVATGATLCRSCHTRVHDEGWRIHRVAYDAPLDRHPQAARLLDEADDRTRKITSVLDARRTKFRFERSSRP